MTPTDIAKLREAAEAAAPRAESTIKALRECVKFYVSAWYERKDGSDATLNEDGPVALLLAFLEAANPSTVLALLDRIAGLEAAAEENGQWIDHAATLEVDLRAKLAATQASLIRACDIAEEALTWDDKMNGGVVRERRAEVSQLRTAGRVK